ncbi:MAG: O-linked GlcNAc transferase-like protein [Clostridiales bacterium]|nr:O-linked GlcNAc transferase-like protein [Clostridiales bacterium]MCD8370982.1 O-linked GlcNAc transferase-like protein [Clostridiales bacterium]
MKIEKGQYGYRNRRKRNHVICILVVGAVILLQLGARLIVKTEMTRTILTVTAILTVLPLANVASPLLASWKYRTPDEDFYHRMKRYEDRCQMLYDLIVTTKEQIIPVDAASVHPNGVCLYCPETKLDTAKAEAALNQMFAANRLQLHIKIFRDEHGFVRRLDSLRPMSEYEDDGTVDYAVRTLKSQSM